MTHIDRVNGLRYNYEYDSYGTITAISAYLPSGASGYVFVGTNSLGDVNALYNANGDLIVKYEYDAWGKVLAETDANGNALTGTAATWSQLNPFRYRGYYYDAETGLYYINSRYYDAEVGRFVNADDAGLITVSLDMHTDKNLFAYCDNNPVIREDASGACWDIAFDILSWGFSASEVMANPNDAKAWVGFALDTVDLAIPFAGGLGEAYKLYRGASKTYDAIGDTVDTVRFIEKSEDTVSTARKIKQSTKIHGNSLKSAKTNYGYVLLDENKNIMKFGETINPKTRYSQKYLRENGYTMHILETGNKADIHYWQYDMNMYYKNRYGCFPPLNKRGW